MCPAKYCGKFGSGLARPCEFGGSESIGERMHVGDPLVQHYRDHLNIVASDSVPGLGPRRGRTLWVEVHQRGGENLPLAGDGKAARERCLPCSALPTDERDREHGLPV